MEFSLIQVEFTLSHIWYPSVDDQTAKTGPGSFQAIDFIIKGLENASRSVVTSRKDDMYKKRQIFYMPDAIGNSRVCEDRIVQARVIAVAEKVVRVEIFGTECSILARDLSWDWLGDATERFHVGEQILVRILSVKVRSLEDISVKADVKSVNGNTSKDNLSKCKI